MIFTICLVNQKINIDLNQLVIYVNRNFVTKKSETVEECINRFGNLEFRVYYCLRD